MPQLSPSDRSAARDALAAVEAEIARFPGRADFRYRAALFHDLLGNRDGALREVAAALERNPGYQDAARLKDFLDRFDPRRPETNRAHATALRDLARRAARSGEREAAARYLEGALGYDGNRAQDALARGDVALSGGDLPGAIAAYRQAIEHDEELIPARAALSAALALQGNVGAAISVLDGAVRLRPQYPDLHYKLGSLYLESADHARAVEEFEAALGRQARYGAAHFALGQARLQAGDPPGAATAFERAREAGFEHEDLFAGLGYAWLALGDLEAAEAAFRRSIQLDDTTPSPHLGLALVAEKRGDPKAARVALSRYDAREHDLCASDEALALRRRLGAG